MKGAHVKKKTGPNVVKESAATLAREEKTQCVESPKSVVKSPKNQSVSALLPKGSGKSLHSPLRKKVKSIKRRPL
jgi:hypothetical protein